MVTTEVATIEPLEGELVSFTKKQATAHSKKVATARDKVTGSAETFYANTEKLYELVVEAMQRQVHKALGVSWAAWYKDTAVIPKLDRELRKEVTVMLAGKTLSLRAIGGVLGVDKHTVANDLAEAEADGEFTPPETVTGLDNKTYNRVADDEDVEYEDEPIDVEYEEEPTAPATAAELVTDFTDEFGNFWNALAQMNDILAEPKWAGAKRRVTKAHLNNLQECKTMLDNIIDVLMSE